MDGLFHLCVIAYFSGSSSFPYVIAGFTFPNFHTNLFPLNLFKDWLKSYEIIVILKFTYYVWTCLICLWLCYIAHILLPKIRQHNSWYMEGSKIDSTINQLVSHNSHNHHKQYTNKTLLWYGISQLFMSLSFS